MIVFRITNLRRSRLAMSLFGILLVVLAMANPSPAQAYENEHYAWTYYLALHVGFTDRQAWQLASAAIEIDYDTETNPMDYGNLDKFYITLGDADEFRFRRKWRKFHAFIPMGAYFLEQRKEPSDEKIVSSLDHLIEFEQSELWDLGVEQRNIGTFLHFLQDRYAHDGFGDIVGHAPAGHVPDYFSLDPDKAWKATKATLDALQEFKGILCKEWRRSGRGYCKDRTIDEGRIRQVLDRMITAQPFPNPIRRMANSNGRQAAVDLMERLAKTSRTVTKKPSLSWTTWTANAVMTYYDAKGLRQKYAEAPGSPSMKDNLLGEGAPDQPLRPYLHVVREAVAADRRTGLIPTFARLSGEELAGVLSIVEKRMATEIPNYWIDNDSIQMAGSMC